MICVLIVIGSPGTARVVPENLTLLELQSVSPVVPPRRRGGECDAAGAEKRGRAEGCSVTRPEGWVFPYNTREHGDSHAFENILNRRYGRHPRNLRRDLPDAAGAQKEGAPEKIKRALRRPQYARTSRPRAVTGLTDHNPPSRVYTIPYECSRSRSIRTASTPTSPRFASGMRCMMVDAMPSIRAPDSR